MKNPLAFLALALALPHVLSAQRLLPLFDPNTAELRQTVHGPNDDVTAMAEYNGALWMLGHFDEINGQPAEGFASWDGEEFTVIEDLPFPDTYQLAQQLLATPDGLVVSFYSGGMGYVYRYANGTWETLLDELNARPRCLLYHEGILHVGGDFTWSNNESVNCHLQFDGDAWTSPGSLPNDGIHTMAVFNGEIYIAGHFDQIGGEPVAHIARWEEGDWQGLGDGTIGNITSLLVWDDKLLLAGSLDGTASGSFVEQHLIQWNGSVLSAFSNTTPNTPSSAYIFAWDDQLALTVGNGNGPTGTTFIYRASTGTWEEWLRSGLACVGQYEEANYLGFNTGGSLGDYEHMYYESCYVHLWDSTTDAYGICGNDHISGIFTPSTRMFSNPRHGAGLLTHAFETLEPDSNLGTLYSSSLWYGGLHDSLAYVSASDYFVGLNDYGEGMYTGFGPISNSLDVTYLERYFGVWVIDADMVQYHINHYLDEGYELHPSIATYPGNGRSEHGESSHLAPFVDVDDNGWYQPEAGDYPFIKGQSCATWITHDLADVDGAVGPGIECVFQAYVYDDEGASFDQSFWLQVDIRNRSDRDYSDFTVGLWADSDIGNAYDDYQGSAPESNYFCGFNGDSFDEPQSWTQGYGENLPAQGYWFPQDELGSYMYYNGSLGINDDPYTPVHYYNYLTSRWLNGQQLYWGGDGLNELLGADPDQPTQWMFPNYPWETGEDIWNEILIGNPPNDRRGVGAVTPFEFTAGASYCLNMGLITAFGDSPNASVMALDERINVLQEWWDNEGPNCMWEMNPLNVAPEALPNATGLFVYPNPTTGGSIQVSGHGLSQPQHVQLFDLSGRLAMSTQLDPQAPSLNLSTLKAGIYMLHAAGQSVRIVVME